MLIQPRLSPVPSARSEAGRILLIADGAGRGMVYFLTWQRQTMAAAFDATDFGSRMPGAEPPELGLEPPELGAKPPELATYHD